MRIAVIDIETDAIDATVIWCIITREADSTEHKVWLHPFTDFLEYAKTVDFWVAHNGLTFDIPVINRLLNTNLDLKKVIDTFVISRLVSYSSFQTHGLDELGASLGIRKKPFNDFSQLTPVMIEYCKQDVDVTLKVYNFYKKYIWDESWAKAIRLEHDTVLVCEDMRANGFCFDKETAGELLSSVTSRMAELESLFQEQWPPELVEVSRIQYRMTKKGELFATVTNAIERYPKTEVQGEELVCYDYQTFNPGSTIQRVRKLWEAGWQPTEKTKTHFKFSSQGEVGKRWGTTMMTPQLYQEKKEHFEYYGWTVSEENLLTLPESAPEAAKRLAEWLTLEGRRSSLVEWIGQCKPDGRIHGKFWHIGAWTHRMAHSAPNSANISAAFHGEPRNAVEEVKKEYDGKLRALWRASPGAYLVGTDAAGIQLRVLCHYMKSEEYREAILTGRKEDETDIHNLNKRALGPICRDRDTSKTFVYAWLLGAGTAKVARILNCTNKQAKEAINNFLTELPGLSKVKKGMIPRDARRGYFVGLDGRKVQCNNEHLMLAGYLQNGEAVATKMWIRDWRIEVDKLGLNYKHVNYVHDEVQVEVQSEEDAKILQQVQKESMLRVSDELGLFCPLDVESRVGVDWYETH